MLGSFGGQLGTQNATYIARNVPLSSRKLHIVLHAERTEKDRFATGQKNYFFGCLMNVIVGIVK